MIRISFFLLIAYSMILSSCSSKKDIIYIQNHNEYSEYVTNFKDYLLKPGDNLSISILTDNPENLISLNQNTSNNYNYNISRESIFFKGYNVDSNGFIDYPQLGKIYVKDKTLNQLKDLLSSMLSDLDIIYDSVIDIKVTNWNFTIIGEVNKPGKYFFDNPNLNLFQAIGIAGDLTINGKRDGVKLLRKVNNENIIYEINLTNSDILSKDYFQIFSEDIIIVNPNTNRVKNAGIIGNSGTLLSLLSFLLSSIIIINN